MLRRDHVANQMEIEFSKLDHRDLMQSERIRHVFFDAYSIEAELIDVADFPPLRRSATDIRDDRSVFLGCTQDGELVAVAEIESEPEQQANIAGFVVHPNSFRKGIGSKLLCYVLEFLGDREVTVSTAVKNRPAISLYEKHGFQIVQTWTIGSQIEMVTLSRSEGVSGHRG